VNLNVKSVCNMPVAPAAGKMPTNVSQEGFCGVLKQWLWHILSKGKHTVCSPYVNFDV